MNNIFLKTDYRTETELITEIKIGFIPCIHTIAQNQYTESINCLYI